MSRKEYKVEVISEGALGTILAGASMLPVAKMEETLNEFGREGWDLEFMVIENRRMAFFWNRESAVITFSRSLS